MSSFRNAVKVAAVEPPLPRDGTRHEREGGPLGDPSVARFLASSPFAVVSSWDAAGSATRHLALNESGGAKAKMIRLLGSGAGAFPRLLRWLIDRGYRKGLTDEGYDGRATRANNADSQLEGRLR
ncbi:hypothetical protein WME79_42125 [Sorangium sp. So ce726]|uniref:hypothetical protein n=1 Tax=Sorangium sp. So ce726 TaxID=3133319 RepID=UPI003F5EE19E